ncbi:MAG: hypothetical protein WCK96_12345 [Methylococcales bacterium]
MFTIRKLMGILDGNALKKVCVPFIPIAMGLTLLGTPVAFADNAVNLKVLVVTTGDIPQDGGLVYIKPVLDEMGVRYDVLNAATTNLTAATLSPNGCKSTTAGVSTPNGCVGNYNGIVLTNADLGGNFTPTEWDILHAYETDFHVREAVLSGFPGTYPDPANPSGGIYLDYGFTNAVAYSPLLLPPDNSVPFNATWTIPTPTVNPTTNSKTVFEYVNAANPLPITDFAFAAIPRGDNQGPRDLTIPRVTTLLRTPKGETLVSVIQYKNAQTVVMREVLLSTISNAWFLTHSQVLSYEFINWVTQGVFVGGRFVHMTNHLDDLFLSNDLWDVTSNTTNPLNNPSPPYTYRLSSADITNAVSKQTAFRTAHKTAGAFKLDFAFNGSGAVVDPEAVTLTVNTGDSLVNAVKTNKAQFRFINHTFTHADMDKPPVPATAPCDYDTFTDTASIEAEITKNQDVWTLLTLPDKANNSQVLVSGNHSGLKDRKCTDTITLANPNPQADDIPFYAGANPLFIEAAANVGIDYLASDTSQLNQDVAQYITDKMVNDGSTTDDRLILPRHPTNIFYNVMNPTQLVDEYNYIFHDRLADPCNTPGAICKTRTYNEILAAEATTALQHMLSFKKYPHFFHQGNLANYGSGNTLQFDWLNSVYTAYEKLFKLPVKNYAYYLIGNKTEESLAAKSAAITAKWDRNINKITLSANKVVPNLQVTGVAIPTVFVTGTNTGITGGEVYGGQSLATVNISAAPVTIDVDQALTK